MTGSIEQWEQLRQKALRQIAELDKMPVQADNVLTAATGGATAAQPVKPKFTDLSGTRDYRAMYRDVYNFHEKYSPPRLDDDGGKEYWRAMDEDSINLGNKYQHDPFLMNWLGGVMVELHDEFEELKRIAATAAM